MREINRSRSCSGGSVKCSVDPNVVGNVSDSYPEGSLVVLFNQAHGVVEIFCIGRVNGHEWKMTKVGSSSGDLAVPIDFRKAVSMVNQACIVRLRKWINAVSSPRKKSVLQQFPNGPAAASQHQQSHGGFVVPKSEPRAPFSATLGFTNKVVTFPSPHARIVQGEGFWKRFFEQQCLPDIFQKRIEFQVLIAFGPTFSRMR